MKWLDDFRGMLDPAGVYPKRVLIKMGLEFCWALIEVAAFDVKQMLSNLWRKYNRLFYLNDYCEVST